MKVERSRDAGSEGQRRDTEGLLGVAGAIVSGIVEGLLRFCGPQAACPAIGSATTLICRVFHASLRLWFTDDCRPDHRWLSTAAWPPCHSHLFF